MSDERPQPTIARTALLLLPVQVVFRTAEAVLPLLLALWFGRSPETDLYYLASAFFTLAGAVISASFQDSALIPILTEVMIKDRPSLGKVAGSLLGHTLAYGSAIAVAMGIVAALGFRLRYGGELFLLAIELTVPFTAYIVAVGVRSFYAGLLNASRKFSAQPIASGSGIMIAIVIIAFARTRLGVLVLPVGLLAGELVAIAILLAITRGLEIRLELGLSRPEPVLRFFKLVSNEVSGNVLTRINPVVDQLFAGMTAVAGGGTLLRYAMDVASLPTSIVQATLLPVLLSRMSELAAKNEMPAFAATVKKATLATVGMLAGMCLVLGFGRHFILRFAFLHGQMDAAGVDDMAAILPYALLGVAPFGALLVLARAHVALQNVKIMIPMGILNVTVNAVMDLVLYLALGLKGVALSTSLMQLVVAVVFAVLLQRRLTRST
ncbi:MAG TPA: lipid II flippase MurJ [Polyangiaceae bacterium]